MSGTAATAHIGSILRAMGLDPDGAQVTALSGGVSSDVHLVAVDGRRLVVKRPRARFAVADEWRVPTMRVEAEAEATRFLDAHLPPYSVAPLLFFDPTHETLVFEAMPEGWVPWKERLLAGRVERHLAHLVGRLLGRIHRLVERLDGEDALRHDDLFVAQRIDPYLRTTATRVPEAASDLTSLEEGFFARRDLVHGDFTPKNILTDGTRPILVDHEVMTRGDAAFDVASLRAHLVLKALHLPGQAAAFAEAIEEATRGYGAVHQADPGQAERADRWLGALLLARGHGKSPVDYLGPEAPPPATELGRALVSGRADLAAVWEALV